MPANAAEWDARHRDSAQNPPAEPASIVSEWLPLLPSGPALDLACGTGRHTLLLAARGQFVNAVDWSGAALDILESRARKAKLVVSREDASVLMVARSDGIHLIQANLEGMRLPAAAFSLILCLQYLQRSLFSQMGRSLRPGGLLLFETFTREQLNYQGGPRNPEYLLEPGELRTAFPELRILFYRELNAGQGIASLVAQKPRREE
ncbi:MAG TPA: class I SAM-dependent methyltransferase [Candidatus Acidoferrum sp.]|nr:class I SAM-dependent methyltransferase [Candidatus Acidoferrum sp.]